MRSHGTGTTTIWPMTQETWTEYLQICQELGKSQQHSQEYHVAIERLKLLPNYPMEFIPSDDNILKPVITNKTQVSVIH